MRLSDRYIELMGMEKEDVANIVTDLESVLDEIEEIAKDFHLSMIIFHKGTTHKMADIIDGYLDKIKQLIKQAKEGLE